MSYIWDNLLPTTAQLGVKNTLESNFTEEDNLNTHQPHNLLMMLAIPPRRTPLGSTASINCWLRRKKNHTTTKQTNKKLPFLFPFSVEKEANWSKSLCDTSKMIGESENTSKKSYIQAEHGSTFIQALDKPQPKNNNKDQFVKLPVTAHTL